MIEFVLFQEVVLFLQARVESYMKTQKIKRKESIKKRLSDLNCQYATLIERKIEDKIDEAAFQKQQKLLLDSIKTAEESEKEQEKSEYTELFTKLKNIKKQKYKLIKLVTKTCFILENTSESLCIKILFS